jgi:hypothetical protein
MNSARRIANATRVTSRRSECRLNPLGFTCLVDCRSAVNVKERRRQRMLAVALDHEEELATPPYFPRQMLPYALRKHWAHLTSRNELLF